MFSSNFIIMKIILLKVNESVFCFCFLMICFCYRARCPQESVPSCEAPFSSVKCFDFSHIFYSRPSLSDIILSIALYFGVSIVHDHIKSLV